ncbi:L-asparaginase [Leucoagaricus sp. SymC.cos]|nr:L-asparaginase [Leucoagaricus sp. SymC.cos]
MNREFSSSTQARCTSPIHHSLTQPVGGTIGMLVGQQGYVPEPYFLTETLRSQNRFHDPLQESLFSNAGTAHLPSLVTPRSKVPGGTASKSIRYAILEASFSWNPLLDSSNMDIQDWIRLATEIELNYHFDAFVVLHGTDTMSYTSSALSFLLEDLGKTVIITGAQIPMSQLRNDAVDNLMGALTIAGHYIIPECCVYFNHTLYRGNRVTKMSSYDLAAFESPNFAPLVEVGIDIDVNWDDVIRQTSLRRFRAHKEMSSHVATLRLFPGITGATIKAFCCSPIRGVVLETFGAGNAPQRPDLIQALKEACDRGVVVVAISQCTRGSVSDAYETARTLLQAGVVPGSDMTPECALTKLSYLLSKPDLTLNQVRDLIGIPLRGELTRPSAAAPSHASTSPSTTDAEPNLDTIHHVLSRFVRLSPGEPPSVGAAGRYGSIAGGIVNCLDPGSGQSPLHVSALNGHTRAVELLLQSGALVHLRDTLGHTALYYAARQGHPEVVELLVKAGAILGGFDSGFADLAVKTALRSGDKAALKIWTMTGIQICEL